MEDSLTSIGLDIFNSWDNWLGKNCQLEIDFFTKMYSRSQIPKIVTQPDYLFSTMNLENFQIDYQNLLKLPWPFSGNFHETQDQFPDNLFEMDERYEAGSQSGQPAFQAIKTGVHKNLNPSVNKSKQLIERSAIGYLSSKNLAPFKATQFDNKNVNNEGVNNEKTEKQEFKNRIVTQNGDSLGEKRTLDSWDYPIEISEKAQVNEVHGDWEKYDTVKTENPITQKKILYSPKTEDAFYPENSPDLPYFKPDISGYDHPIWQTAEKKRQDNSIFSSVKGWGELAEMLNDKSPSGSSPEFTPSEVPVSPIITTHLKRAFPEVSEKPLSTDTYSTFRNLSNIGKETYIQHLPFTSMDLARETPTISESEALLPDTEEMYEALAAKLRREYNRYYGP